MSGRKRLPRPLPRATMVRAFTRRDFLVSRSYRLPFVLDAISGVLFLGTYYFISRTFEGVPTESLHGAPSYFAFAAVGAAIGAVVETSCTGIANRIRQEQLAGTLEMLAVQPLTSFDLCLGLVGFPFLFGLFRAALYLGLAYAWIGLDVTTPSWPGVVVIFVTTGAALATIGIISGAFTLVFKGGVTVVGFGLFALALLSGSVFPISTLPEWLQPIGNASPLRFAFDGARSALFQGSGWESDALWLALFGAVGMPIAALAFDRALHHTKRRASLGQY
jgi:ABC-2 type transport system permease protein